MKIAIFILLFLTIGLNAKVIEAKQLFNKKLIKVKQIQFKGSKQFYAKTQIDEKQIKDVNLRFDGFIHNLRANEEHKFIKKNTVLFSIYSKELVATFEELLLAKEFNRKKNMQSIIRKLELLNINKKIISSILRTKKIPYYINIRSLYDGIIVDKKIYDEGYVKQGQSIFKLINIKTLWVDINVYQKDISLIKKGDKVTISIDGVGSFKSKIDFIHPIVNSKTNTIIARATINNQDLKVFPNMFATAKIETMKKDILVLPKTAIFTKAKEHFVFKPTSDNQFEPIKIEAKRLNTTQFEILSGLNKDDIVINNALFLLDSDAITNGLYDLDDEEW